MIMQDKNAEKVYSVNNDTDQARHKSVQLVQQFSIVLLVLQETFLV